MMEITKENFAGIYEKEESNLKKLIKENKFITLLLISLISFTSINVMLIYSFVKNVKLL